MTEYQWGRPEIANTFNTAPPSPADVATKAKSPTQYIMDIQKFRTRQDLLRLRIAVDDSENIKTYNRYLLHQIYRDIIDDPNLESQWGSRKMKTIERPFKIIKIGDVKAKEVSELTEKLNESLWFYDFLHASLDSILWNYSLVEFGPMTPDGDFMPYQVNGKLYPPVNVIDRDNVKPELGIITSTPGAVTGIAMTDPSFSDYLIFIGKYRGHGLLKKLVKYILFKDNCLGNWSEWAEVFGMDSRVGYTDAQDDDRERFIRAIRDMGSGGYGVFTSRDKVEFTGTQRTDAYKVYKEFCDYVDAQVSKAVFGQDVVSNNTGRIVGTVGENVANMYGVSDSKFVASCVNQRLFPMMSRLGFTLFDGYRFTWDTTEKLELKDRATVDKQIHDMGFDHSEEYINKTYGTEVTTAPEPKIAPGIGNAA